MSNLYLGIKGHVVCIEKMTGKELWNTKLKGMSITNVFSDAKNIYAYASGHLFCLDAAFGEIQWKNTLSGYGYGSCIFASSDLSTQQQSTIIAHDQIQKDAQSAQAAT